MPKVTVRMRMKGGDLKQMMAEAKSKMADLGDGINWKITDMEMYGEPDDVMTKQGMMKMYDCSMTLEADVKDG